MISERALIVKRSVNSISHISAKIFRRTIKSHFEKVSTDYFGSWTFQLLAPKRAQCEPFTPITRRYPLSTSPDRRPTLFDLHIAWTEPVTHQAPSNRSLQQESKAPAPCRRLLVKVVPYLGLRPFSLPKSPFPDCPPQSLRLPSLAGRGGCHLDMFFEGSRLACKV
jgi:hypothetical protein